MTNPFTSKTVAPIYRETPPADWQTQQAEIDYQRKLAEMLQSDTEMPQGQMVGGIYVAPSWTQMLAKALNPLWAKQHMKAATEKAGALEAEKNAEFTNTIERVKKAMTGTPEEVLPENVYGPPRPAVPGSRDAALMELGKSRDPQLRNLYMAEMLKGMEPAKYGNSPHYDQNGRAFVLSDQGSVKYLDGVTARDKLVADNLDGKLQYRTEYDTTPRGEAYKVDPNKPFAMTPLGIAPNMPFQNYAHSTAKASAPRVTIENKAESSYAEEVSKGAAKRDEDIASTAFAAKENLYELDNLINHLKTSDAITGMGAELFKNIERAVVLLTDSEEAGKTVSDTELLDAMMGSGVFPMIKELGIGARGLDTRSEREFLRQVMTGSISMNKDTLIRMTETRKNIALRAIDRYNKKVKSGELDRYFQYSGLKKEEIDTGAKEQGTAGLNNELTYSDPEKERRYQEFKARNKK